VFKLRMNGCGLGWVSTSGTVSEKTPYITPNRKLLVNLGYSAIERDLVRIFGKYGGLVSTDNRSTAFEYHLLVR